MSSSPMSHLTDATMDKGVITGNLESSSITTLTAQDLQDSLVEQSLSETILLQNVNFDPNLFDGLNLDLEGSSSVGAGGVGGSNPATNTNLGVTEHTTLEQLNLLDTLELQILKEVQSSTASAAASSSTVGGGHSGFLNSSDPMVSSTTTLFYGEKDEIDVQSVHDSDSLDFTKPFGAFTKSPLGIKEEPQDSGPIKGPLVEAACEAARLKDRLTLSRGQESSKSSSSSSSLSLKHKSELRSFPPAEKVFLTTGPLSHGSTLTTLSLAGMKVVSGGTGAGAGASNVLILSDVPEGERKAGATMMSLSCGQGSVSTACQTQPTRLIIIEEKKTPTTTTTVNTNANNANTAATTLRTTTGVQTTTVGAIINNKETTAVVNKGAKSETSKCAPTGKSASTNAGATVKEAKGNIGSSTGSNSEVNQFTDADSNSGTPSSKAFVPCKVCGDKASGYHYGVTSCEGCKGFFRRSIQKQIEYRCLRDGKCLIIRLNRNRCQYCRFKKCLAVGMSRDSVRYGRVPKKSKEKERLEEKANGVTQAEADQSSVVDVDAKDLALYDTILTISQAHHANCSYTEEKIKGIGKKPIFMASRIKLEPTTSDECSSSPDVGSVSESLECQKIELWEQLALLITPCIQRVVEFAKRIPGFSELTQDDQLIMIKLGFFEVWLVHISKTADFTDNTLTFADGSFLNRKQLELLFDTEFVGNLFHLMSGLNNLALNDTEIGLFSAIILLQSDRPQIYDIKAINKIQEMVLEALKTQITRNHASDTATFPKLMLKIGELRALGSSHSLQLHWFRSNWLRLHLPPLFAEIWDIPLPGKGGGAGGGNTYSNAPPQQSGSCPGNSGHTNLQQQQQQQQLQNDYHAQAPGAGQQQLNASSSSHHGSPIENSSH